MTWKWRALAVVALVLASSAWSLRDSGGALAGPCDSDIVFGEVDHVHRDLAHAGAGPDLHGHGNDQVRVRVDRDGRHRQPGVLDPRGGGDVCPKTFADEYTCEITVAGTQTLRVDANGSGTGSFVTTIQRLNNPTACPAIAFGPTGVTASIVEPLRSTAAPATARSASAGASAWSRPGARPGLVLEVVRPDGTTVCAPSGGLRPACLLDTAGTHRILVSTPAASNTGNYRVVLEKFPAPVGCTALTFGTPVDGDGQQSRRAALLYLQRPTRDRIRIRTIHHGRLSPVTEVFRADGTTVCANTFADELTCALTSNGTHTIMVRDAAGNGENHRDRGVRTSASTTPPPVRRSPSGPPG